MLLFELNVHFNVRKPSYLYSLAEHEGYTSSINQLKYCSGKSVPNTAVTCLEL